MKTFDIEPEVEVETPPPAEELHGPPMARVDLSRGPVLQPQEQEQALAHRGEELERQAKALVITDAASFVRAGQFLETVEIVIRQVEQFFEDDIARAHATWKGLTMKRALYTKPLEVAKGIVAPRYTTYERDDKARADAKRREKELEAQKAEQERLRLEAEAREEEARQLAAAALTASSRDEALILQERAEEALNAAQEIKVEAASVEAPVLPLLRDVPDIGPKVRANWVFEVTDKLRLVRACADGTVSLEAVEPNETYLRKRASADKATFSMPGVRVWDAGTVTKRRTPGR